MAAEEVTNATGEAVALAAEFPEINPIFRGVVKRHGREMFLFVMNAGMARQACGELEGLVQKHHSRGGIAAVGTLAGAFNQVSNGLVQAKGWTEGQLVECDRDIQLAFRGQIVVAGPQAGKIILNG